MSEKTEIVQKSLSGNTIQIATQNNYYGMTPEQASQLAIDLFMQNFPQLQEIARKTVEERVEDFIKSFISKLQEKGINDFTPFSEPDVQYILVEAEKTYARFGTKEMLDKLALLVAKRIEHDYDFPLKVVIDKAITVVPMLTEGQMDFLSLLFICYRVRFTDIQNIEDLKIYWNELCTDFSKADFNSFEYLNMMGCLLLDISNLYEVYSKEYGINKEEIISEMPETIKKLKGDYNTSQIGTIIGIINAETKTKYHFSPQTWIH